MSDYIIEFKDFTFKYTAGAEPTLFNIDLKIKKGEKILICGPSGCGKSTLSHCINGLIPSSYDGTHTGDLLINGKSFKDYDIFSLSKIVGTVLQDSDGQFIGLTVGEDISFALENDNVSLDEMKTRVKETAKKVGMENFLSHAPYELSGGQKQRVSLAGIMVDKVDLFLFDEPLANLDPKTGKSTIELIDEIHKETGSTVIIIEHRLEDALYKGVDRVILMNEGRILSDTSPDELLSTSLLKENGIREPLYVSALKYSGVDITKEIRPGRIDTLTLTDDDKNRVRSWFTSIPKEEKKIERERIIEAKDISFSYKGSQDVLKNINFYAEKGEMLSIVGKNGAGKSTFSKVLCGFEKQQKGELFLSGENMSKYSIKERAERIGYVMQNPNQMITKSMIRDEVALGLDLRKRLTKEEIDKRVDETLKICGLYQYRSWPIGALSYGQKKRVTIASILVLEPEVIILDEPTAGQDFKHYTDIMEFLKELNKRGTTIILITHDMHLMLEYSERAVVFADGEKIADTTPEEILTNDELTEKASLKKTSLSDLAKMTNLDDTEFIRRFISYDRKIREIG